MPNEWESWGEGSEEEEIIKKLTDAGSQINDWRKCKSKKQKTIYVCIYIYINRERKRERERVQLKYIGSWDGGCQKCVDWDDIWKAFGVLGRREARAKDLLISA